MFKEAFGPRKDSLSFINIGRAIGAFERTLNASSPFDKYLNGDIRALSKKQRIGLSTFIKVGCTSCHSGELLGGSSYQKIGQVVPYPTHDKGRFNVTGKKRDLYKFKVPSLRNVEMTGPYFHDGSVKSLDQSIALMGKYQLGKDLSSKEIFYIKEFLKSLTSKI